MLFLCTGNSCRSQIAQGWTNHLHGDTMEALSAGTDPHGLDPRAVQVMAEAGVDISRHASRHVGELSGSSFDVVITVCDRARETCPVLPGSHRTLHAGFDDPPKLAASARSEEEALRPYRRVRDEIRAFALELKDMLKQEE